ncbi:MAG: endonuclease III [Anaerolineae bacterium]|nr:endonuclease III [Anaerolineae bacterium]
MNELDKLREKYQHIAHELAALYGYPTWRQHKLPVAELVDCILSQSTNDANRDRAFALLTAKFSTWEAVRDAATDEVIAAIKPAGLANQKGPRIQQVLRTITERRGSITLDFLRELSVDDAKKWLTSLNGVGPKTAAIVLCFAFGLPAFPVDTHVHRVSQRLGLIGPKVTPDQAHAIMERIVPADTYYQAHLNIIEHGRKVCQARRPACERCPLTPWCDYYQQTVALNSAVVATSKSKPQKQKDTKQ